MVVRRLTATARAALGRIDRRVSQHVHDGAGRPDRHVESATEASYDPAVSGDAGTGAPGSPDEVVSADTTPRAAAAPLPIELTDFNHLLHALRSVEVSRMPRAATRLLSVGCSDRTYFDWLHGGLGEVREHWGVELYRPEPDDLPAGVRWIVASASSMPQVPDGSVDVVFSGQNIEHLAQRDLVGFLRESRRVLADDGVLVVDSPNRLITEPLQWRHPEHVVELSPAEATRLLELAGFDVAASRGVWLCEDADGTILPLMPEPGDVAEVLRRSALAADAPDRSFCWWIEARASARAVDEDELAAAVAAVFAELWHGRVNRAAWCCGEPDAAGGWRIDGGAIGPVYVAGPIPMFGGSTVTVDVDSDPADEPWRLRVVADGGIHLGEGSAPLDVDVAETVFGVWCEVWHDTSAAEDLTVSGVRVSSSAVR